jgi:hypothetical protein
MGGLNPNEAPQGGPTPAPPQVPSQLPPQGDPRIEDRFPRLQQFVKDRNIFITNGEGDGFAEIFPTGERDSPDPTRGVIQVRPLTREKGFDPNTVASGDALHFLGGVDPATGEPLDKEFYDMKQDFFKNMSPEEKRFAKKKFNDAKKEKRTGSNFESEENFLQNVWGDAIIREAIFPELTPDAQEREDAEKQIHLTPRQKEIVKEMQQSLSRR